MVVLLMVVVFFAIISHFGNIKTNDIAIDNNSTVNYIPKKFLSNNEYNFLTKFIDLESELHVNIVPQVNLASVIEKVSNSRFNTELFRNIDFGIFNADYSKLLLLIELNDESHNNSHRKNFGIFNADYSKLLLLIELNDESHNNSHRKKRDIKVHDICDKAGIKIITFYTKYSNEKEYVKSRIIKEINISSNSN